MNDFMEKARNSLIDVALSKPENFTDIKSENGLIILTPIQNAFYGQIIVVSSKLDIGRLAGIEKLIRDRFQGNK